MRSNLLKTILNCKPITKSMTPMKNIFIVLFYTSIISFMFLFISLKHEPNISVYKNKVFINQLSIKSLSQSLVSNKRNNFGSSFRRNIHEMSKNYNIIKQKWNLIKKNSNSANNSTLELCPLIPPGLMGRIELITESSSFEKIEEKISDLKTGGRYKPIDCDSRHKVAIIIPFRDREAHLKIMLSNIHPMLKRQQIDYGIYVIEQFGNKAFNRAMLMNIGFLEALKQYDYQCFIFHDVDLIPEDDRNFYTCAEQPRHMSVAINNFKYKLQYPKLFGGVTALTKTQFERINGFSNRFWGWGGEDDDVYNRLVHFGYKISRYPTDIARYTCLTHEKAKANPKRYDILYSNRNRYKTDGINSVEYIIVDLVFKKLFTWILVDI